jgi:hypothetical protein
MYRVVSSCFFLSACALLLGGCAAGTPPKQAGADRAALERTGPRQLNEAEILRTLRGRTLEGQQSDRSYVRAFCSPDGKVSALVDAADGRKFWSGGAWEVRQDALCFRWRNRDWTSGCASVSLTGSGALALKPVSGGPSISGAKVLDGNPYSLAFN